MQRALTGHNSANGCLLQPAGRRQITVLSVRSRRPTCQAASTLSNGEAETTAGGPLGVSKSTPVATSTSAAPSTPKGSSASAATGKTSAPATASSATASLSSAPTPPQSADLNRSSPRPHATSSDTPAGVSSFGAGPAAGSRSSADADSTSSKPAAASASSSTSSSYGSTDSRQQEAVGSASRDAAQAAPQSPLFSATFLRRLAAASSPLDVAEALSDELPEGLREDDARAVLGYCVQRGKVPLALALYREMCLARRGGPGTSAATRSLDTAIAWPAASLATTRELVLGLCQQLCIVEALQVLSDMKVQGLPRGSEEVGFGKVIISPLAPDRPLTVVQPQEGIKTVADGYSRYEYEVFTGTTVSCSSTALVPSGNLLLGLGRALGLIKKPPVAAVHEFVLQAPDSTSRTFRVGTDTAAVPAQVGERLTVVSAPTRNVRKGGIFNASPPGTKPGEALTATNHRTGVVLQLLRPPTSTEQTGVPGWVLPVAVVLAGGDAASSLLDPALPLLLAAGAASVAGSAALGSTMLVPRLKQLPDGKVRVELMRQQLLAQYNSLSAKAGQALAESAEDVRVLARLWQLQNKMQAVSGPAAPTLAVTGGVGAGSSAAGGGAAGSSAYEARIGRVSAARAKIEERLSRRIELLEGYSRVMNMIEIEVEMDIEVPAAELAGIEEQVARLVELEGLQEDWRAQAEARDEVERLLRIA